MGTSLFKTQTIFFVLTLLLGGCSLIETRSYIKRPLLFRENYNLDDTISVGFYQEHANAWKPPDSLYNHVRIGLENSGLSVHFSESGGQKFFYDFERNSGIMRRNIDLEQVIQAANACLDCTSPVLIPIINVRYERLSADSATEFMCFITLYVFLVQNDEIIYYKERRMWQEGNEENYNNYDFPVPQEKWDRLVREAMKEYIERLVWKG